MELKRCKTVAEFTDKIISHPKLKETIKQVRNLIQDLEEAGDTQKMIMICGPTGTGKTTLLELAVAKVNEEEADQMHYDPAFTPAVYVIVSKLSEARSIWKQFWKDLGTALGDILVDSKSLPGSKGARQISRAESTEALRSSVLNQLKFRRTNQIYVDEPQHLLTRGQGRSEKDNFDILKSHCTVSKTICVLAGPYELKSLITLDGQLIRRSIFVHFSAYGTSKEDRADFEDVIMDLAALLPLELSDDVDVEMLVEGSLGCVGLLKDWLARAAQQAMRRKAKVVVENDLRATGFSLAELDTLATEIVLGESLFNQDPSVRTEIRKFMGLSKKPEEPKKPQRKYQPGLRGPTRDQLG